MAGRDGVTHAPPVDADEQEQPDNVDEMPVPSRRFEAEMMVKKLITGFAVDPLEFHPA